MHPSQDLIIFERLISVRSLAIRAIRFYVHPDIQALNMIDMFTIGELLYFLFVVKILEAYAASGKSLITHIRSVCDYFDLLEF